MADRTRATTVREPGLVADHDLVGTDGQGRDQPALEHGVRVEEQDRAVLVGAGLPLRRVHDDGGGHQLGAVAGDRSPLPAGGEAGAATAPETGSLQLGDQRVGADPPGGRQPLTTALVDVLV